MRQQQPQVRVVIPAFGVTSAIRAVVEAVLQSRNCPPLQVVVVDDGRNCDLHKVLFGTGVEIVFTGGSGSAAVARNRGAQGFGGTFLVFVDADVVVDPLCIAKLLKPLQDGRAEATMGNYSKDVQGMSFAAGYKQLYISRIYERRSGYVKNDFWSAMAAMDNHVFQCLSGFDPSFSGACGEDGELGGRMTRHGYSILAVPDAIGHHRKPLSVPQLLQNDWRKGLIAIRNYFRCNGSIGDNRHATRRDVAAVTLAALELVVAALAFHYSPLLAAAAAAILGIGYLAARADILQAFSSQGPVFVARACGLMFLLDLMRLICVAASFGLRPFVRLAEPAEFGVARTL